MTDVYGNTAGISTSGQRALERLFRRRVPLQSVTTPELVRSLAEASRETHRQVGVLLNRAGDVEWVVVGTASGLMLPDIGRLRAAEGRFRGLRLVHTHLFGEGLTHDDLVDLTRLRLDLVCALLVTREFEARAITWAYNIPPHETETGLSKPYLVEGPHPYGRELPDFGELISALEAEFAKRTRARGVAEQRAILVHVAEKKGAGAAHRAHAAVGELKSLSGTAGVRVVDEVIQLRDKVDPKWVLGKGKLEEVVMRAIDLDASLLIFGSELSPSQAGSIAGHTDLQVIDRTQLILDIFAQRAETRDGKLQVELAQLKYRLPRLGLKDDALSRLTGGIGGRGPGETKLEIGRRRARERVTRLERALKELSTQRSQRRAKRRDSALPVVAIVGYTNAGKSTLLNALTQAGVLAEDKLFATLDTRARRLRLPSGAFTILTDTVGFIRDMPRDLFAAFRATFEETADADLLLEVVDASNDEFEAHIETTEKLLDSLGLSETPRLKLLSKLDLLSEEQQQALRQSPNSLAISVKFGDTLDQLLSRIDFELTQISERKAELARLLEQERRDADPEFSDPEFSELEAHGDGTEVEDPEVWDVKTF